MDLVLKIYVKLKRMRDNNNILNHNLICEIYFIGIYNENFCASMTSGAMTEVELTLVSSSFVDFDIKLLYFLGSSLCLDDLSSCEYSLLLIGAEKC